MTWRFLIDANLPPALARAFEARGYEARHVSELAVPTNDDIDIWGLAVREGLVVVSKDADFAELASLAEPRQPVVWLRMGNTRRVRLLARIDAVLPEIIAALDAGEWLVEVR